MQEIRAAAQYHDFSGQVAADGQESISSINRYMQDRGLINDGEFVIAIDFYAGEKGRFSADAIVAPAAGYDDIPVWLAATADPLPARKVSMNVSIEEFFSLFKRFSVVMAPKGLDVIGRHIQD